MPAGAKFVGRGTKWGNPYKVGMTMSVGVTWDSGERDETEIPMTLDNAVEAYRRLIENRTTHVENEWLAEDIAWVDRWQAGLRELRGLDLACWCPLIDPQGTRHPCHADVLLDLSNR